MFSYIGHLKCAKIFFFFLPNIPTWLTHSKKQRYYFLLPSGEDWTIHVSGNWSLAGRGLKEVFSIMIKSPLAKKFSLIDCNIFHDFLLIQTRMTFGLFTACKKNFPAALSQLDFSWWLTITQTSQIHGETAAAAAVPHTWLYALSVCALHTVLPRYHMMIIYRNSNLQDWAKTQSASYQPHAYVSALCHCNQFLIK